MVCLGVILLFTELYAYVFVIKDFCNKKGVLFVPDPVSKNDCQYKAKIKFFSNFINSREKHILSFLKKLQWSSCKKFVTSLPQREIADWMDQIRATKQKYLSNRQPVPVPSVRQHSRQTLAGQPSMQGTVRASHQIHRRRQW